MTQAASRPLLSWTASGTAAAGLLAALGLALAAEGDPGESRGDRVQPIVLTLAGPEAVAAIPTPPPEVATEAPDQPELSETQPPLPTPITDTAPPVIRDLPEVAAPLAEPLPTPAADIPAADLPISDPPAKPQLPKQAQKKPDPKPVAKTKPKTQKAKPKAADQGAVASTAGDAGQTKTATRSDGVKTSTADTGALKKRWGSAIRKRIEARKSYPAAANGAKGSVTLRLTISRAGALQGVSVAKSSGNAALDQAAVKAAKSVKSYPAAPKGMAEPSYSFTLPMTYSG